MRIRCYIGKSAQLNICGFSLAGLFSQPDCKTSLQFADWIDDSQCIAVDIDGARLVIDVHDQCDQWNPALLDWCHVYAKRNIDPAIPAPRQDKIVPFGLNVPSHSKRSALAALAAIAAILPSGFRPKQRELYVYLVTPHWKDLEHRPDQPVDQTILYQTRLWESDEAPNDEVINDERVALLRALRAEFKHRFAGGLVSTSYSRAHHPELITQMPTRQPQYIRWAKKPAIAVYSRGLFGSMAFKMAEYLAASKCIVTDPIRYTLQAPITHVAEYTSPEECIVQCQNLLSNPELVQHRRQESWLYYNKYVRTPTAIRHLIDIARQRA